ncbi:elongation factor P maturation arginine rhamnosyltransferase EarP [Curvibacter sp. CHRR-16]|uniref:elongation factor P maturation arginine rhamnosyltransferase EarP n=1 Tax=Curvibacter sp. CHRR-16 TaxID=2835872 RepID=UPI001BDA35F9|nr:elongation factor P maturation arginine rhamnosyltransferase EarP [Curvibacter sp. CHRR-16]MBT0571108.1 elongation factor P maturation arginine rhamnosyltransferase EarP [Curvibacter sp. CHRR-16]
MLWDIFCTVIDNYGDAGVCWRLSHDLSERGHQVRLWMDDATPLGWMAPGAIHGAYPGITVLPWSHAHDTNRLSKLPMADVWIEAFGCEIATNFIAHAAYSISSSEQKHSKHPIWINLEYLSAETYVERCHRLPSPVLHGPLQGHHKFFFYPGWTARTGGLLREPDLCQRQTQWQRLARQEQLQHWQIDWRGETVWSLFCYEPLALATLLERLQAADTPQLLLVTAGRASQAVQGLLTTSTAGAMRVHYLPHMTQQAYDQLLWSCDVNCVRGEDSIVRALWAGKPWLWQIYPQDDGVHADKLNALLDTLHAPAGVRHLHHCWNDFSPDCLLPAMTEWQAFAHDARQQMLEQTDLTSQLLLFVEENR